MKTIKLALGLFIFAAVLFTVTSFTAVNNNDEQNNVPTQKQAIDKAKYFIPTNG
ncbi:MAG: hypothetical protein Q8S44_05350 [Flavobacteriaceae bacterium]|nr:hypothetical protein [Flavobacteriaceae bacterium]